jgi:hypothetical protein
MVHYTADYNRAIAEEARVFPIIQEFFQSPNMVRTTTQYAQYDYYDERCVYELKTRFNILRDQYDTTIIQSDKCIPRGMFQDREIILLFNFTDYLCYIKYDRELFKTFTTEEFARQKDRVNYSSPHTFIPRDRLQTICKWSDLTNCDDCGRKYPHEMMAYLDGAGYSNDLFYCPVCLQSGDFEVEFV